MKIKRTMSALGVISLTTITSASAQTYKTGESGKTTIDITAKKGSASTKTRHKPMDLMMLIDNSGSTLFKDSDAMQRMTKELIEDVISDDDRVILVSYKHNNDHSYATDLVSTDPGFGAEFSKRLTKKEALDALERMKTANEYQAIDYDKRVEKKGTFGDIYDSLPDKNKLLSIIQFTDSWGIDETIDTRFATWAKKNAKTFMSVINPETNPNSKGSNGQSIKSMQEAGHTNILTQPSRAKLAETYRNTATEIETVVEKGDSLSASITAEDGITIQSAKWILPDGNSKDIAVSGNQIEATLEATVDGIYKLEYTFVGNVTTSKKITGQLSNGKDSKTVVDNFEVKKVNKPRGTVFVGNDQVDAGHVKLLKEMVPDTGVEGGQITPGHDRKIEIGTKPKETGEVVHFKTEYRGTEQLDAGQKRTIIKGQNGGKTMTIRYRLKKTSESYRDDASYKDIHQVTKGLLEEIQDVPKLQAPVNEVIEVGLKPKIVETIILRPTQFVDNFTKLEGTPSKTITEGHDGKRIETTRYTLEGSEAKPHTEAPKEETSSPRVVEVYKGRGTKFVDENGKELATEVISKDYEDAREFKGYRFIKSTDNGIERTHMYRRIAKLRQVFLDTKGNKIKPDYIIENVVPGQLLNVGHPWGIDYQGIRYYPQLEKLPIEAIEVTGEEQVLTYIYDVPKPGEPNVPLENLSVKQLKTGISRSQLSVRKIK